MPPVSDQELLRRYADHGSEDFFTELVRRHLNLVWSAARRVTNDPEMARDVAQLVFADLARKARGLPPETLIAGWLYRAASLAAAKQVRGEMRRSRREQISMPNSTSPSLDESQAADALQPVLDEALAELPEADRDAVVLRFLAGRTYAEVGAALGISDDTAQKRVSRALEKLRATFGRRGLDVNGGLMVAALACAGAQAAPAGLVGPVAAGALAAAGPPVGGAAALAILMKAKLTLGMVAAIALVATVVLQRHRLHQLADDNLALRQQLAVSLPVPSSAAPDPQADPKVLARLLEEQRELLRLRGEVAQLRQMVRAGQNRPVAAGEARAIPESKPEDLTQAMEEAEAVALRTIHAQKHLALALHVHATEHQGRLPTRVEELKLLLRDVLDQNGDVNGVSLDLFEFHPHEREIGLSEPGLILLREKQARRLPDGTWERIYSLADGSVQRISRANGDFSDFEMGRTATQANAPRPR